MIPRILPPALWALHWLTFRARVRKICRGCRTVRGALGLLAGIAIFGGWMTMFFVQRHHAQPQFVRDYVPFGLLMMCVLSLVFSKSGQGIAFQPAEVEFLFPGPFRRRDLLLHRIVGNSLMLVPTSLMFSLFFYPHVTYWLAGFAGTFLALQFQTMFQVTVSLLAGAVRERLFSFTRLAMAVLIVVGLAVSLSITLDAPLPDSGGRISQLRDTWPGRVILFPFDIFGKTMAATSPVELAVWGLLGTAINVLLVGMLFLLDLDFREASLKTSQRMQQRLQSIRSGRLHWTGGSINIRRLRYISLPWLRGAGPVASYQMTTALRSAKGMIGMMLFILVTAGLPMFLVGRSNAGNVAASVAAPALMFVLFFFPQFVQFDYRGDVDRMGLLKTLPLRPIAITCGQLVTPVVFLLVVELLLISVMAISGVLSTTVLLNVLAFLPLVNLMLFAIENLMWLLYPCRTAVAGAADIQAMVRQMLLMLLKMIVLSLVFGAAIAVGAVAWLIADSVAIGVVAAWFACAGICVGLIRLVAQAFNRFDPATDTPA